MEARSNNNKISNFDDLSEILTFITQRSYEETAIEYAKNVENHIPKKEIEEFANQLPFFAVILDMGCGSGRDAKIFCDKGFDVIGIDFSHKMLEIAKITAPLAQFHFMSILNMNFPKRFFDGIWANCSLLHIPKEKVPCVLNKIYSFLKIHGIFSLVLKKGQGEGLKKDFRYSTTEHKIFKFWAYYTEEEITGLLERARFKIVDLKINQPERYVSDPLMHIFAIKLGKASL